MEHMLVTPQDFLLNFIQNGSTLYGFFLESRQGVFSPAMAKRFGAPHIVDDLPYWMVESGNVADQSIPDWLGLFTEMDYGKPNGSAFVTLKSDDGSFGRYWLRWDVILDDEKKPYFAIITSDNFTALSRTFHSQDDTMKSLMHAAQLTFPEIIRADLKKETYRIIHYRNNPSSNVNGEGLIRDLVHSRALGMYPKDRKSFTDFFAVEHLLSVFESNPDDCIKTAFRIPAGKQLNWIECTVTRQKDTDPDQLILVVMTRNITKQKAEEIQLQEQLRLQEQELNLTLAQMDKVITYYDIATRTMTCSPIIAQKAGIQQSMKNYPESLFSALAHRVPEELIKRFTAIYDEICQGHPRGSHEIMLPALAGRDRWLKIEYFTIFDSQGTPVRAVVASEDITSIVTMETENKSLKQNEFLLKLTAQHSDRVVCHYDIITQKTSVLDADACSRCHLPYLCELNRQKVINSPSFPVESQRVMLDMFAEIEAGKPSGKVRAQVITKDGERRWFDVKFSTIYDETGDPVSAILSHKDITEEYEHELAYLRQIQALEIGSEKRLVYIESDLTSDRVENIAGQILNEEEKKVRCRHSDFGPLMLDMKVRFDDAQEASRFFSCDNLMEQYSMGKRELHSEWHARFPDGSSHWLSTLISLVTDPYNGHVKAFIHMEDITVEKEFRMEIQHRSQRDSMTGLYNRAHAEELTKRYMELEEKGILILLDLDDLKKINDIFGHKEGDRAIMGITKTLRSHFRETDVIGRIGGDEFLVFLPGAAESVDAISVSLTSLLRKLSSLSIGEQDERRIHCSLGCAVQTEESNTFDELFEQADTALYHVKRGSKNNFAFYTEEMDQADYQFRKQKILSERSEKKFEMEDLQHLLGSIAVFYQLVLSVNLSSNDYYLMEETTDGVFSQISTFGSLDRFIHNASNAVHPDDLSDFLNVVSRQKLLEAYERNEKNIRYHFRFFYNGEYRWTEAIIIFYVNDKGDVCDFTLIRWADERADELYQLWLRKVLELAVISSFEYICLVNLNSGNYYLYCDDNNSHAVEKEGNFTDVTCSIRDHLIPPMEKDAYYEDARLETIARKMKENDGTYSYRYNMPDGMRQASFYWFEPTHVQVLMTVQRCDDKTT